MFSLSRVIPISMCHTTLAFWVSHKETHIVPRSTVPTSFIVIKVMLNIIVCVFMCVRSILGSRHE